MRIGRLAGTPWRLAGRPRAARVNGYGGSYADRTVSKLNNNLFLVMSIGTRGSATQSLAAVLRLMVTDVQVNAAVTAGGDVQHRR